MSKSVDRSKEFDQLLNVLQSGSESIKIMVIKSVLAKYKDSNLSSEGAINVIALDINKELNILKEEFNI